MPRARNIKPGFFESEDPAKVGYPQRLLWIALWTLADREGRLEYRAATFKKYAFGFDHVSVEEVAGWTDDLFRAGLIDVYEVGSTRVIQCVNFARHQRPHRLDPPSIFPPNSQWSNFSGKTPLPKATFPEDSGKHALPKATFPEKQCSVEASPRLNVECRMLNVECGEGEGALSPAPPPPQRMFPEFDGPDPQAELQALAVEIVGKFPAGGSVSLTEKALEYKWHLSGDDIGQFCAFVRSRAYDWRKAWDENGDMRRKAAQFWVGDGDYKAEAPKRALVAQAGQRRPIYEATKPIKQADACKRCAGTGTVLLVDFAKAMSMDRADDALGPCPECAK